MQFFQGCVRKTVLELSLEQCDILVDPFSIEAAIDHPLNDDLLGRAFLSSMFLDEPK